MSNYPDANKLMFFTSGNDGSDDEYEYELDSDDEDMVHIKTSKISLNEVLEEENILVIHQIVILGILTWSIKDRLTISEVRAGGSTKVASYQTDYCHYSLADSIINKPAIVGNDMYKGGL
jgi:hypothetical protein